MCFVFLCCFTLFYNGLQAQKESAHWYFGYNGGIDFTSGSPVADSKGKLNTDEGCAVLSDSSGALLFYTDGSVIWNRNHQLMLNSDSLYGNTTSTQSAIIVPKPGSAKLFYVFTIDAWADTSGLRYSVVDMDLDGGLGAVTSLKNVPIVVPTTEKITAIRHANGKDFWIVTHLFGNNIFHSYLLTENGLNTNEVLSQQGIYIGGNANFVVGYLKSNHAGNKLVCANRENNIGIFDFDQSTGIISNHVPIDFIQLSQYGPYGVEFSPNDSLLYVAIEGIEHPIYQFDITSNDPNIIVTTQKEVGYSDYDLGALQLAPDGKIYVARSGSNYLGVIEFPNKPGIDCGYIENGFLLTGVSAKGLPNFSHVFIPKVPLEKIAPPEDTTEITLISPNVFTPNQDGVNDVFYINFKSGNIIEFKVHIFNRWGSEVAILNASNPEWDGTFKGNHCAEGTYFWIGEFRAQNEEFVKEEGIVTLLR